MGMVFFHYSTNVAGTVFEIYPLKKGEPIAHVRLGFAVQQIEKVLDKLAAEWEVVSHPKMSEWGKIALLMDLEGRKVELTELTQTAIPV